MTYFNSCTTFFNFLKIILSKIISVDIHFIIFIKITVSDNSKIINYQLSIMIIKELLLVNLEFIETLYIDNR